MSSTPTAKENLFPIIDKIIDHFRFQWLCADLENPEEREARNRLLERMPSMSYSAICTDIDYAMDQFKKESNKNVST